MTQDPSNAPHPSTAHERVRAIFFEVCDLHGAERDAALDRACGDDALRAEVLRLLRRDAPENDLLADDVVDSGAAFAAARTGGGPFGGDGEPTLRAAHLPSDIGGYRILRRIGIGGMGTVYEAEQRDPRRIVALKTLQRWTASPSLIRRFRHEAQVLGRLQHPGIAQIFEASVHDPGDGGAAVPFFVMELIRGRPVTAFIRERRLSIADRLRLFILVCDAVAYAHHNGVIHRDLKPDNILVDEMGQPKILDFGVAKTTDSDRQVTTMQTDVGQLVGTLPYMSPEQVGGDPSLVDTRSDVYALGVVLYEMLTDRLPYPVRDRSIPEAVRAIREESHTRLSAVDRGLRGDLETILSKALEKTVDRRYQSAPQLSQDIQRYLDHEPISARPPSTFYQFSKFARRNKALVGGVAGVIVALALGVIGTTKFALDAKASAREAAAREREQRWSSYLARIDAAAAALARHDVPAARRHLDEAPPEHRGWEWRHLERSLAQPAVEIDCGAEIVGKVSLLPGDGRVVAALADGRICSWDIASGQLLRSLAVDGGVWRMADAAAGPLVAVATNAGEIAVVDMDAGNEIDRWSVCDELLADGAQITDLAIAPDGAMVVLGTTTEVVAWRRPEHRVAWRSVPSAAPASSRGFRFLTISADGSLVAAAQSRAVGRSTVWTWSLSSGAEGRQCRPPDAVHGIALHPEGRDVAIGAAVRDIMVAPIATMRLGPPLNGHTAGVRRIAYSPDGRMVASQSDDSTIRVRSVGDGTTLHVLHVPPTDPADGGLVFSADGSRLVSRGARRIVVWDIPPEPSLVLRGHRNYVYTVAFSPDGAMLASGPFQGDRIRLWDPRSGEALAEHAYPRRPRWLRFTDDGRRVEIHGRVERDWDTATGVMVNAEQRGTTATVEEDLGGEDGPQPVGTRADDDIEPAWPIESADAVTSAASSGIDPSGRLEARVAPRAGKSDVAFTVQLQHAGGVEPIASLAHESKVVSTAFSPDQALLAVGCDNGEIIVWDVARRSRIAVLRRHTGRVYAVTFSPDGRRLASGGNDNSLRLWDTATWDQVLERHEHTSYIYGLAFSPDGTQLASASGDMTVRVWDSVGKPERLAQVRADAALRDEMRPHVAALLEGGGADQVAATLRADRSLDDDHRRAALRVLLESARGKTDAAPSSRSVRSTGPVDADRAVAAFDAPSDAHVEAALELAGANRPEIERFLARYDDDGGRAPDGDPQKRIAARWLVANMPGHGFARTRLVTADGHEVPFDISEHRNLEVAQSRLEALEQEHGPLQFKTVEFVADLATVTAAQLIQNHELAFESWRGAPWAGSIPFETFLERILPYRATNERLDPGWRAAARDRMRPVLEKLRSELGRDPTLDEAARAAIKAGKSWLRFRPIYYLHPDDQNWTEMGATGAGRCEDESNMALFAGRAAAVPLAGDSTPFWADRDNNHAWVVALDGAGSTARAPRLAHRAAKVVRNGYAAQPSSLGAMRRADEPVPGWLAGKTSLDVTAQYVAVSDVTVTVGAAPDNQRFAYLCVFNGGAWRPVHWSEVGDATATFTAMGRGALYLPAWYGRDGVTPAGAPVLLALDGTQRRIVPGSETFALWIEATTDELRSASEPPGPVRIRVAPDLPHELFVWDIAGGAWRALGQRTATLERPASFEDVPAGGLYWLRAEGRRRLERPFTVEGGAVVRW